jgi:hypothetical protein
MLSSRDADDVPVMNCNDAREGLSVLSRYGMGLTEWVLADAHVRQCAECRKALENIQELVSAGQRVAPHRALQRWLNAIIDAVRFGTTGIAASVSRVRALLSIWLTVLLNVSELFARTAVIVVAGTGFVIARCADVLGWPRSFRWVPDWCVWSSRSQADWARSHRLRPPAALVLLVAEGPVPAGRPGCVRGRQHHGETLRAGLIERGWSHPFRDHLDGEENRGRSRLGPESR